MAKILFVLKPSNLGKSLDWSIIKDLTIKLIDTGFGLNKVIALNTRIGTVKGVIEVVVGEMQK